MTYAMRLLLKITNYTIHIIIISMFFSKTIAAEGSIVAKTIKTKNDNCNLLHPTLGLPYRIFLLNSKTFQKTDEKRYLFIFDNGAYTYVSENDPRSLSARDSIKCDE